MATLEKIVVHGDPNRRRRRKAKPLERLLSGWDKFCILFWMTVAIIVMCSMMFNQGRVEVYQQAVQAGVADWVNEDQTRVRWRK